MCVESILQAWTLWHLVYKLIHFQMCRNIVGGKHVGYKLIQFFIKCQALFLDPSVVSLLDEF